MEHRPRRAISARLVTFIGAAIVLACAARMSRTGQTVAPATVATEGDDGSTIVLRVGETLRVQLQAIPSAGYSWKIAGGIGRSLRSLGPARIEGSEAARRGAPVYEVFQFIAEQPGTTSLFLVYERPFEADRPPARSFRLQVRVEPLPARSDPQP